jgi:uncharacterized membrane protein YfcA
VLAGVGVGICTGLFGVGGSSVATPVLALLGAPALIAVASPLPATIPSSAVGAVPYLRSGEARPRAVAWSWRAASPARRRSAAVPAGRRSRSADRLWAVLAAVGLRVLLPADETALAEGAERRHHRALLAASMALVGVFTGLLANGGGFAPADDLTAVFIQLVMPIFPPSVPRSFITPVTAQGALTMLSGLLCEIMAVEAMFSVPWLL